MSSNLATPRRAAQALGVSESTVRNYISRGYFPAYRVKGRRGVVVDLTEARRSLARLPRAVARPHYGTFGPNAQIHTLEPSQ